MIHNGKAKLTLRKRINFLAKNLSIFYRLPYPAYPISGLYEKPVLTHTQSPSRFAFFKKLLELIKRRTGLCTSQAKLLEFKIYIGVGSHPGYNPSIYIQGSGQLTIGRYPHIGQNSGVLSGDHDTHNHLTLIQNETKIGDYNWIGMNSILLRGVQLGKHTIVPAISVVTKSFPQGHVNIGGNPAKIIKHIDPNKIHEYEYHHEYIGYYREQDWLNNTLKKRSTDQIKQ